MVLELWYCERSVDYEGSEALSVVFTKQQAIDVCNEIEKELDGVYGLIQTDEQYVSLMWEENPDVPNYFTAEGHGAYHYFVRPIVVGERF